jgi:hypothetical protein
MSEVCTRWYISVTHKYVRSRCWFLQVLASCSLGFWGRTILWFTLKPSSSFVHNVLALFYFGLRWTPRDEFYSLERCNSLPFATIFLMFCLEHWWMPQDELSFMALQTNRSISIDWSVRFGLAFSRRPPPIYWLCKIPSCHCWEHQLVLCEKQMLIPSSSCKLLIRFLGLYNFVVRP